MYLSSFFRLKSLRSHTLMFRVIRSICLNVQEMVVNQPNPSTTNLKWQTMHSILESSYVPVPYSTISWLITTATPTVDSLTSTRFHTHTSNETFLVRPPVDSKSQYPSRFLHHPEDFSGNDRLHKIGHLHNLLVRISSGNYMFFEDFISQGRTQGNQRFCIFAFNIMHWH